MSENDRRDGDSIEKSRPVQCSDIIPESSSEVEAHKRIMDLEVAGPDRQWVEHTFNELDPFFTSVRLGGMYRPLLTFRNQTVVHFFS